MAAARNQESNAPRCPRNRGWMRRLPCRYWLAQQRESPLARRRARQPLPPVSRPKGNSAAANSCAPPFFIVFRRKLSHEATPFMAALGRQVRCLYLEKATIVMDALRRLFLTQTGSRAG